MPCKVEKGRRRARRSAVEQRIVRLALLLLANEVEAVQLSGPVLGLEQAGADLASLQLPNVDRLVVLRAREVRATEAHAVQNVVPGRAGELLRALHALPGQAMEAWIFAHVEKQDLRRVSRTMDCSTTAIARHLEYAERELARRFPDDVEAAAAELRAAYEAFDPAPAIETVRAGAARWRARRRTIVALSLALLAAAIVASVLLLT